MYDARAPVIASGVDRIQPGGAHNEQFCRFRGHSMVPPASSLYHLLINLINVSR